MLQRIASNDGARFFKAVAELGLEGIVSKRAASRYRSGPSRSWVKTKNMVESEFILLGTERDSSGIPWALLATEQEGRLAFAGPAIFNLPRADRPAWMERMAELALAKPPLRGLNRKSAQWLRPELRVRVKHLKAKGMLRHASVRQLITEYGVRVILVESPDRFARGLAVQLAGHDMLKGLGIDLIPASAPDFFTEDTPTAVLVAKRSVPLPNSTKRASWPS